MQPNLRKRLLKVFSRELLAKGSGLVGNYGRAEVALSGGGEPAAKRLPNKIRRFKFRIGTVDFALLQMFFEKNVFKQICKDRIGTVGLAPRPGLLHGAPQSRSQFRGFIF